MKGKATPASTTVSKTKKVKAVWTKDSAYAYISKNAKSAGKGLKYWGAFDFLKKFHPELLLKEIAPTRK